MAALLQVVIGAIQKCVLKLPDIKSEVSAVAVANNFVPLMNSFKSIKEDADKLKKYVEVSEVKPNTSSSVTEKARELLLAGIQNLEMLLNKTITFLYTCSDQQVILIIGGIINQVQKKMENRV